jgi:hypothetical protein
MKKSIIFILSLTLIHIHCDFKSYDGSKLISLSYSPNEEYDGAIPVSKENFDQDMLSYYSWFASYGYCEEHDIPSYCCENNVDFFTKKWNIISGSSTGDYLNENFVLWRSDEYKKYIVSFPGTRNKIVELLGEIFEIGLVDYNDEENGIKVAKYFKDAAFKIKDLLFQKKYLDDINEHPGYQFISVGHSLGGAVATIILYEGVSKGYIDPNKNEPVLITFGQPRTGNEEFVIDFNKKIKNIFRVVRDGDLVVDLPPQTLIGNKYCHLGGLILVNKDANSMISCPKEIGEDYPDKKCQKSFSINLKYHTNYFNPEIHLSRRCDFVNLG